MNGVFVGASICRTVAALCEYIYIYYTLNRFVQTVCTGLRLVSDMEGWTVVLSDERRRSFSGHRAQAGEGTTCEILS